MNLNEKNFVLASALDDINYIVTENARNNPGGIKKQYDCNKAAFDQIAKEIANVMRSDLFGKDEELSFEAEAELAKKRGLIGNCANSRHIMSWNYSDELDIVCRATGNAEGNEWDFFLEELGRVRARGTVYGGKWLAIRIVKAMRNGLTSFRCHRRKSRSNRAACKSAELAVAAKEGK